MRDHLLLFINGKPLRIAGDDVFMPLSDFLRRKLGLTGTKVVCAEGDCGSCTVLLGRVAGGAMDYLPVTSCIQSMYQLDATHVVTVEGLRDGEQLNPVQQSMVKCHGAQCGFCTPGFVVAAYDLIQRGATTANDMTRGLVGNLCRCTGYNSIIRAAMETDRAALKRLDELYPPQPIVAALESAASEAVEIELPPRFFCKPVTMDHAVRFRAAHPDCVTVSGGTDIGVQCNKGLRQLAAVLSTACLPMRDIKLENEVLSIGASATLSDLERATLQHIPEFGRFLAWFGSPLIKNAGTLAGNLVNASPISDTIPALFVLNAEVELTGLNGTRRIPINQIYAAYRKTVMTADEIMTRVFIPLPRAGDVFKLYKVSRRKDLDIATFGAAIWMKRSRDVIEEIRIAYGGVAPTVVRLRQTESFLTGQAFSKQRFEQAARIAAGEVAPISDVRGSDEYRRLLASNILLKFWHEVAGGSVNGNGNGSGDAAPSPDRLDDLIVSSAGGPH